MSVVHTVSLNVAGIGSCDAAFAVAVRMWDGALHFSQVRIAVGSCVGCCGLETVFHHVGFGSVTPTPRSIMEYVH